MTTWRGTIGSARAIASLALVLTTYAGIFHLLDHYDWGEAFVRFACLAGLLALTLATTPRAEAVPAGAARFESVAAPLLAIVALNWGLLKSSSDLDLPPVVDIGQTTQQAARMVLIEGRNPYQSRTIAVLGDDPSMWGFKYGPTMILGYAASAYFPVNGIKYTSLACVAATAAIVFLLGKGRGRAPGSMATAWFCCALAFLPNRLWYELFRQGSNDILPVLLILGSILAVRGEFWGAAGLLAGLSLSAKLSPAAFYLALFIRRRPEPRFVAGVAAGLLPLVPFLAWDAGALFRNVVLFHSNKSADSTSLYSITPRELHPAFSVIQLAAIALAVSWNFRVRVEYRSLVAWYLGLILVCEMSYREVHGNHLLWFMPFEALRIGWNRHAFLPNVASLLSPTVRAPVPVQPAAEPSRWPGPSLDGLPAGSIEARST